MKHLSLLAFTASLQAADLPINLRLSGAAGDYTEQRWKQDWPGCEFEDGIKEGHVQLQEKDGQKWLRVNYAVGAIGPEKCGTGWRWPIGKHHSVQLIYMLRFSHDFDFVKGGKLPGLCGGQENVSGGRRADGSNGFSVRLMWRKDGRGEAYVYHKNQPDKYGESFAFPEDFRFPTGTPIEVRLAVGMNRGGERDGFMRIWITLPGQVERLVVDRVDMEWRSADAFNVDSLLFETFHGGNDSTWAPTRPCYTEFAAIRILKAEVN